MKMIISKIVIIIIIFTAIFTINALGIIACFGSNPVKADEVQKNQKDEEKYYKFELKQTTPADGIKTGHVSWYKIDYKRFHV